MLTVISPELAIRSDVSDSGAVRAVDLSEELSYSIEVTHPLLDATDRDTILSFYASNRNTFTQISPGDGRDYDMLITTEPTVKVVTPIRFTLTSKMVGNKV